MAEPSREGLSTRGKLWIGFGTLTALLALFCIAVLYDLRAVERDLYEQAEVARPRSAAARQIEINLLGYALAVRSFLHLREARFLEEARREAQDLDDSVAAYARLAQTPRQRELVERFRALWEDYRGLTARLMTAGGASDADTQALVAKRVALEKLVDADIQLEARQSYDATKAATAGRLRALMRLAVFLLAAGLVVSAATGFAVSRSILRTEAALQQEKKADEPGLP